MLHCEESESIFLFAFGIFSPQNFPDLTEQVLSFILI